MNLQHALATIEVGLQHARRMRAAFAGQAEHEQHYLQWRNAEHVLLRRKVQLQKLQQLHREAWFWGATALATITVALRIAQMLK